MDVIDNTKHEVKQIFALLNDDEFKMANPSNNDCVVHLCQLPDTVYTKMDISTLSYATINILRAAYYHHKYAEHIAAIYEQYENVAERNRRASPYFQQMRNMENHIRESSKGYVHEQHPPEPEPEPEYEIYIPKVLTS